MVVISIIFFGLLKFIDILPGEYFLVLVILLGIFIAGLALVLLSKKGHKRKGFGVFLSIAYIIIIILVIIYELNTIGFLKKLGFKNYKTENYSVLVLKDSSFNHIEDLKNKKIGSLPFNSEGINKAKTKLNKLINPEFFEYDDVSDLKNSLLNEENNALLIENSILDIIDEDDEDFKSSYKIIYEFSLDIEIENLTNKADITKEPFNIYISGIDTYGKISSVSRSDVNMLLTINPVTNKILITSIPRDYYVTLAGKNSKDKLTHAGIYGIETSIKTISNLLDVDVNYYVKVNFSSLIEVVDAIGGVNVYSKYSFTSKKGNYHFQKGYNYVFGEQALAFVRERKSFSGGDRVRVENQAAMLNAIFTKATSPSILTKYSSLLNALSDLFITNIDKDTITEFIKMQLDKNPSWTFINYSLDGYDANDYTYSYGRTKLYVMKPNEQTVINAQTKIKEVMQ